MSNNTWAKHFNTSSAYCASRVALRVSFGVIAAVACLSNGFLCYIIWKVKHLLFFSYNVLIFSLAATDFLNGILIAFTPGYIVSPYLFKFPPNGFGAQVFCRVIGSQYIVFSFGKFSAFIVTFMALERWYAVVKPSRYRTTFTKRRVLLCIIFLWFFSFCIHTPVLFEMSTDKETGTCIWVDSGYDKQALITCSTLVTFFIPTVVTWLTYSHIASRLKASPLAKPGQRYLKSKARFLSTCMVVALLLTICWLPNQIYYMLSSYGLVALETPIHHFTTVLVMLNSCVNPFVYCFSNRECKRALLFACSSCVKLQQSRASVDFQTSKESPKNSNHTAPITKDYLHAMFTKFLARNAAREDHAKPVEKAFTIL